MRSGVSFAEAVYNKMAERMVVHGNKAIEECFRIQSIRKSRECM
jgi:hypothetical protein